MIKEPVAWMVASTDGKSVFVTTKPTLSDADWSALPLYALDRKDVLILDLYREQQGLAWDSIMKRQTPCGECHLRAGERCDICGAIQSAS